MRSAADGNVLAVAVARGDGANLFGVPVADGVDGEVIGEALEAFRFTADGEKLLAEVDIVDDLGELKTQLGIAPGGFGAGLLAGGFAGEGIGFNGALLQLEGERAGIIVIEVADAALRVGLPLDEFKHFEAAVAGGENIHAAIFVAIHDMIDGGRAAHVDDALIAGEHDAEFGIVLDGLADHFLVAFLEDMERKRSARKQDQREGKERQQILAHGTIMAHRRGMDIQGKVVLITGASEGIGAACAARFRERGALLALMARNRANLERVAAGNGLVIAGDVTADDDRRMAVDATLDRHGRVDILINSAGAGLYAPAWQAPLDTVRRMYELNFFGALGMIQRVVPHMRRQAGGCIVNVSSIAGKVTLPWLTLYSASKYALGSLTDGLRMELRGDGIHAMSVCPGYVSTKFQDHMLMGSPPAKVRDSNWFRVRPEECAEAIARGVEKNARTVVTPRAGWAFVALERLFPGWIDRRLEAIYRRGLAS